MKTLFCATLLILTLPTAGLCESCDTMIGQLTRLRNEFHRYATADEAQKKLMTFEELVTKLDEIIDVKKKMRQAECRIPSRSAKLDLDKYSSSPPDRAKKKKRGNRGQRR